MFPADNIKDPSIWRYCYVVDTIVAAADAIGSAFGGGAAAAGVGEAAASAIPEVVVTAPALGAEGALAAGAAGLGAAGLTAADIAAASGAAGVAGGLAEIPGVLGANVSPTGVPTGAPSAAPTAAAPQIATQSGVGTGGAISGGAPPGFSIPANALPSDLTASNIGSLTQTSLSDTVSQALPGAGAPGTSSIPADVSSGFTTPTATDLSSQIPNVNIATPAASSGANAPGLLSRTIGSALGVPAGDVSGAISGIKDVAGPLTAGVGLAQNLLQPQVNAGMLKTLQSQAGNIASQGANLQTYLNTGSLPPGAQAAVKQATNSAKAAIRSQYASMGLSGSTMESEALAQADANASAQVFNMGSQLMQTGLTETGMANSLYESIIGINNQQNAATGSAIANLAAALSGGRSSGNTSNVAAGG